MTRDDEPFRGCYPEYQLAMQEGHIHEWCGKVATGPKYDRPGQASDTPLSRTWKRLVRRFRR